MIRKEDIDQFNQADGSGKRAMQERMQQDELDYLAYRGFEEQGISFAEIEQLYGKIDQRIQSAKPSSGGKMNMFVSLLCGLFIGVSVFFVAFHQSKVHPSIYAPEPVLVKAPEPALPSAPSVALAPTEPLKKEYLRENFSRENVSNAFEAPLPPAPENLPSHQISDLGDEPVSTNDIMLAYVPNAPVVFIKDLKITNYRLYYLRPLLPREEYGGVAAQYDNHTESELARRVNKNIDEQNTSAMYLNEGLASFNNARYGTSIARFRTLLEYNHDDVNALFYTGMSYYYLGYYNSAQDYLGRVLSHENNIFHQEAAYYKGLSLQANGDKEAAREVFKTIIKYKGFYAQRAEEALAKLQ